VHEEWKQHGGWEPSPIDPKIGILGSIVAGNYTTFQARRDKVKAVGRMEEAQRMGVAKRMEQPPKYIPPHLRRPPP
jgi:hypothetical protein